MPSVSMIQQGIGFGPETNSTGLGALLGLAQKPGPLITADQRRLGLTELHPVRNAITNTVRVDLNFTFLY